MDPVTIAVLVIAAVLVGVVLYWTWDTFGGLIQIVAVFTVLGLIFGFFDNPKGTEHQIVAGVQSVVQFAHQIRDAIVKP